MCTSLAWAATARADRWVAAELPAAWPVSDAQASAFRPGALPALGVYQDLGGMIAVALRVRAGALANGAPPGMGLVDPGLGGLTSAAIGLRLRRGPGWVELAGGGGLTGSDPVPTFEVGAGWGFAMRGGAMQVGPSLRYVRLVAPGEGVAFGNADLLLAGVEVRVGRRPRRAAASDRPPGQTAPAPWYVERDRDRLIDLEQSCAADPACAPASPGAPPAVEVQLDRIIVADHILFEFNRARVTRAGQRVVRQISQSLHDREGWTAVRIEGHSDARGSQAYNQWLSTERAARVREVLVAGGIPADRVEALGFGATRPRQAGSSETALARNRRVEIVILAREVTP
jgi:outer membrane protein OmpA-like peptidoglycan-associated protein